MPFAYVGVAASVASAASSIANSGSGPNQVGSQTATQTNPTQEAQLPFLQAGWNDAKNLYNQQPGGIQYYPGNTLADVSPQTTAGINAQTAAALAGNPVIGSATNAENNFLSGNYLSAGNPYFGNMVGQLAQSVQPQVASGFESSGRYGSGAQANAFASALTNQAGQMAYQNYNQGLQNQVQALTQAPSVTGLQYQPSQQLESAGAQLQGLTQPYVTQDVNRYNTNQQAPYGALLNYMNSVGQPTSGSISQQMPIYGQNQATGIMNSVGNLANNQQVQSGLSSLGGLFGGSGSSFGGSNFSNYSAPLNSFYSGTGSDYFGGAPT